MAASVGQIIIIIIIFISDFSALKTPKTRFLSSNSHQDAFISFLNQPHIPQFHIGD